MAKKTSVMDDMVEGVKSAAETVGQLAEEAVGIEPEKKVYERIVSIPEVKVHRPTTGSVGTVAAPSNAKSPTGA